jgi:hypothetical protein
MTTDAYCALPYSRWPYNADDNKVSVSWPLTDSSQDISDAHNDYTVSSNDITFNRIDGHKISRHTCGEDPGTRRICMVFSLCPLVIYAN